jgi:hypothetical protein
MLKPVDHFVSNLWIPQSSKIPAVAPGRAVAVDEGNGRGRGRG